MAVLSLGDAKDYLRITGSESNAVLQGVIDAAVLTIANRVGPLEPKDFTTRMYASGLTIVLPYSPIVSVTSVTPVGSDPLVVGDLSIDLANGILARTDGYGFLSGSYDVAYRAGWTTLPADLVYAVKEQVRFLWASQRGLGNRPGPQSDVQLPGYLMPNVVASLIAPYRVPGVH